MATVEQIVKFKIDTIDVQFDGSSCIILTSRRECLRVARELADAVGEGLLASPTRKPPLDLSALQSDKLLERAMKEQTNGKKEKQNTQAQEG